MQYYIDNIITIIYIYNVLYIYEYYSKKIRCTHVLGMQNCYQYSVDYGDITNSNYYSTENINNFLHCYTFTVLYCPELLLYL